MTSSASRIENGRLTLSDLQTVRFQESKGFGRGYDEAEVDAFVARCASELQRLTKRVDELEAQASTLATKGPADGYIATQSATILSVAQQTADTTVKNADEYSARVMAEARTMYDDARRKSSKMLDDAHRLAADAIDQANERHEEVERQTVYLRALRDSTKVQVETFLSGLLDHVTSEYGRALPAAAEAVQRVDTSPADLKPLERPERPVIEQRSR
jgi:DivIVA domain-containing protein